ncbi:MAG: NUDIX hydrolase [Candidatus Moranbacteria bacterium]|nr:NUDIX hydrolase [Candidatus Moranbacteria bacterium]
MTIKKYIISAGLIFNKKNQILLVKHTPEFGSDYYWTVPGGSANENEDKITALLREVKEETGVDICKISKLVYKVKHINYKREWDHDIYTYKIDNWKGDLVINDPDNDTVDLKWFDIDKAINVLKKNPFRVIKEPLIDYLIGKERIKNWDYLEDKNGKIARIL